MLQRCVAVRRLVAAGWISAQCRTGFSRIGRRARERCRNDRGRLGTQELAIEASQTHRSLAEIGRTQTSAVPILGVLGCLRARARVAAAAGAVPMDSDTAIRLLVVHSSAAARTSVAAADSAVQESRTRASGVAGMAATDTTVTGATAMVAGGATDGAGATATVGVMAGDRDGAGVGAAGIPRRFVRAGSQRYDLRVESMEPVCDVGCGSNWRRRAGAR